MAITAAISTAAAASFSTMIWVRVTGWARSRSRVPASSSPTMAEVPRAIPSTAAMTGPMPA